MKRERIPRKLRWPYRVVSVPDALGRIWAGRTGVLRIHAMKSRTLHHNKF